MPKSDDSPPFNDSCGLVVSAVLYSIPMFPFDCEIGLQQQLGTQLIQYPLECFTWSSELFLFVECPPPRFAFSVWFSLFPAILRTTSLPTSETIDILSLIPKTGNQM